ncbi:hypothetical protein [Lactococcus cremoris]|nr:hypothetical protein [Lactococcus cremoris]
MTDSNIEKTLINEEIEQTKQVIKRITQLKELKNAFEAKKTD